MRSRPTWSGSSWRPGRACWPPRSARARRARSDIHLASTSSASGQPLRLPTARSDRETRRSTRSAARPSRCRRRRSGGADRAGSRSRAAVPRPPTAMNPSSAYIAYSSAETTERMQLARPGLGPALATGVIAAAGRWRQRRRPRRRHRSAIAGPKPHRRQHPQYEQRRGEHAGSTARRRREEDHPLGIPRDLREIAAPSPPRAAAPSEVGTAAHIP